MITRVQLQLLVVANEMCDCFLRLIQAMETYGHLWSISKFGSHASLTSHGALELERGAPSLGYGEVAIRGCRCGCKGEGVEQQVNTCSQQVICSQW